MQMKTKSLGAGGMRFEFDKVTVRAAKSGACVSCGKKTRRTKTFWGTVNPFNRDESGKIRDRDDVRKRLEAERDEWVSLPTVCASCESDAT